MRAEVTPFHLPGRERKIDAVVSLLDAVRLEGYRDTHAMWVSFVNNRAPQGTLVKANDLATGQAQYVPTAQLVESYFPAAEDALILAL